MYFFLKTFYCRQRNEIAFRRHIQTLNASLNGIYVCTFDRNCLDNNETAVIRTNFG
ncbi:hypothetical protein PGB90_007328 [Kerria lacca]